MTTNTNAAVDSIISTLMTQVQVCASAYALIGSRFDRGHERENFETEMADLRNMLDSALSTAAQPAENTWAQLDAMRSELATDIREVFDANGPETPQIVRDVIGYADSWLQAYIQRKAESPTQPADEFGALLAVATKVKPAPPDYADAYQEAREDLAIWKRRALEAESALRTEQEASSRLAAEVNEANGPTHLGEPVQPGLDWQIALELGELLQPTRDDVEKAYRRLASRHHPDKGGDSARMAAINKAREQALDELS